MDTTLIINPLKLQVQHGHMKEHHRQDMIVFTTTFALFVCKSLHRHM